MITWAPEKLADVLGELKPHFPDHYEELALDKEYVPLDPQYDTYLKRCAAGEMCVMVGRASGSVVGYVVLFVTPGLHYRRTLTAIMDIFWLAHSHRSFKNAIQMVKETEKELRRRGVKRWFMGSKWHKHSGKLFEYLGFKQVEVNYSKWLGEDS